MRVSVIIPVYNVERYLARCLDSVIAAANGLDVEIVCVNDGSADGSAAILDRYASSVPRSPTVSFRIVTKANGGLGSARNAGLEVATGDYILFVDSDDYIPPYAIAAFLRVAEASGARLVVSASFVKDDGVTPPDRRPSFDAESVGWRSRTRDWVCGHKVQYCAWNKLYHRSLWRDRRFPDTVFEDFPTTTGVFCDVDGFAVIDEPLYVYCVNPGATTLVHSSFGGRKLDDSLKIVRQVYDYAKGRDCFAFALRQAADGLSSTVSKIYRTKDVGLYRRLEEGLRRLESECPDLVRSITWRARFRLWRIRSVVR